MTDLLVALGATAAVALMYVVCLRPMRHGHCLPTTKTGATAAHRDELNRLRAEIDTLKQTEVVARRGGHP